MSHPDYPQPCRVCGTSVAYLEAWAFRNLPAPMCNRCYDEVLSREDEKHPHSAMQVYGLLEQHCEPMEEVTIQREVKS